MSKGLELWIDKKVNPTVGRERDLDAYYLREVCLSLADYFINHWYNSTRHHILNKFNSNLANADVLIITELEEKKPL